MILHAPSRFLDLEAPQIMGILNVTPDSFYDGGRYLNEEAIKERVTEMIEAGVSIIDIGGESTGPGSIDVTLEEEIERVIPVIEIVRKNYDGFISIDTYKSEVALKAIEVGADMVNDITAMRADPKMAEVIKEKEVPVCLMYSKDEDARTTKEKRKYDDVVAAIKEFLGKRVEYAKEQGIDNAKIILDPGMGAFISMIPEYSFEIIKRLGELKELGYPILVGTSRKFFLGGKLEDRLEGSIETGLLSVQNGANILRVHDIKETARALDNLKKVSHV